MTQSAQLLSDSNIERLLKTFKHEPTDRVPNLEYLIDRRNVEAILGKPAAGSWGLSAADYLTLARKIGMDAVGGKLFLTDGQILSGIGKGELRDRDALQRLERAGRVKPAVVDKRRLEDYLETLEGTGIGLWVHLAAGLTAVYEALGFENFCLTLYDDIAFIEELLDLVLEDTLRVIAELTAYEFSFFHIGDDLGFKSGLIVPPDVLEEIWKPRVQRLLAPILRRGFPVTFHSDGNILEAIPMIVELGFCALNPIEPYGMDIYDVKERYGDSLCLVGNIDIAGPLAFGSADEVRRDVSEHLSRLAPGGGYVCATSHSVIDGVPPENYRAMLEVVHASGKSPPPIRLELQAGDRPARLGRKKCWERI